MRALLLLISALFFGNAFAQQGPVAPDANRPDKGWFWYETNPVPEKEPEPEFKSTLPTKLPPPPKEEKCAKKETWSVDCGFVNPGEDFEFQSKQRDALMQRMSVAKNDLKAVEAFQYYMRYVIERTSEVTNNWWYNMAQNPDLDPAVSNPVSAFGIRLMTEVRQGKTKEVFGLIKAEGGFLVYFTRSDCVFCHQMSSSVLDLGKQTGLEVRNASLDSKCLPQFAKGCMTSPATDKPAQALQVATVPTVFLHIPPRTWIRVATGVVDTESMVARTSQFFAAYRSALLSGTENGTGGRPSVNFSGTEVSGASAGASGAATSQPITPPSTADIEKLLKAPSSK